MIQTLKKNIALLITAVVVALSAGLMMPALSSAATSPNIQDNLCGGAELKLNQNQSCKANAGTNDLNNLITNIVNIFSIVVGVIAVIMIIVGGFKYITSGGDSSNVTGAKNTIMYAVIGLVIVALAQIIVRFVLDQSANL